MASAPAVPGAPAPTAAPAAAAPEVSAAEKLAQDEAALANDIRSMLIYELRLKGYSPHPSDVLGASDRIKQLLADSKASASAYVLAKEAHLKAYADSFAAALAAAKAKGAKEPVEAVIDPGAPIPAPLPKS